MSESYKERFDSAMGIWESRPWRVKYRRSKPFFAFVDDLKEIYHARKINATKFYEKNER